MPQIIEANLNAKGKKFGIVAARFNDFIVDKLVSPPEPAVNFHLTDRELEVLVLLAEGLTNQQSALKLSISQSTLKFHMNNIYHKLGVQTRSEALVLAAKNNLI